MGFPARCWGWDTAVLCGCQRAPVSWAGSTDTLEPGTWTQSRPAAPPSSLSPCPNRRPYCSTIRVPDMPEPARTELREGGCRSQMQSTCVQTSGAGERQGAPDLSAACPQPEQEGQTEKGRPGGLLLEPVRWPQPADSCALTKEAEGCGRGVWGGVETREAGPDCGRKGQRCTDGPAGTGRERGRTGAQTHKEQGR